MLRIRLLVVFVLTFLIVAVSYFGVTNGMFVIGAWWCAGMGCFGGGFSALLMSSNRDVEFCSATFMVLSLAGLACCGLEYTLLHRIIGL